jgi:hypothetical protein
VIKKLLASKNLIYYIMAIATVILAIDYWTGRAIQFSILYIIPIALTAWSGRPILAYSLAIFLPLARIIFYLFWQGGIVFPDSNMIINTLLRIAMLAITAIFVNQARLITGLRQRVKTLEGILPICASCKNIRNENGGYEQIEEYISRHSNAQFSHGICPECMRKLYPGYAEKIMSKSHNE